MESTHQENMFKKSKKIDTLWERVDFFSVFNKLLNTILVETHSKYYLILLRMTLI